MTASHEKQSQTPPANPPIPVERSAGSTASECYLQSLCERTFLRFWSHPCVFQDDGVSKRGEGKELCDLLVVFGNNVLIFSDKHCAYPVSADAHVSWCRWFKRAIQAGANQIYGAERWIKQFPHRLFLDRKCQRPFPVTIPRVETIRIHRIVVAHGSGEACRKHFGGGSGSLMLDYTIRGSEHLQKRAEPLGNEFKVGWIDSSKGFVHVFDDTTLDIVLRKADTVADFVAYLTKKESFVRRMDGLIATGEEDLLGFYLRNLNSNGEHDFVVPSNVTAAFIDESHWASFLQSPQRKAQTAAERRSYLWDQLIEKFSFHIMRGSQHFSNSQSLHDSEKTLRFLASENRVRRRMLVDGLYKVVTTAGPGMRAARVCEPGAADEPFYVFLALPTTGAADYEEYRTVRRELLYSYCLVCRLRYPDAKDIVGIAMNPASDGVGSEDLLYFDGRTWAQEQEAAARSLQSELGLLTALAKTKVTYHEYPVADLSGKSTGGVMTSANRNRKCPCGSGKKFKKCCGT